MWKVDVSSTTPTSNSNFYGFVTFSHFQKKKRKKKELCVKPVRSFVRGFLPLA